MSKFSILLIAMMSTSCVPLCHAPIPHATGTISGKVINVSNRPVPGAHVMAIYTRGWTTVLPPVPSQFVVAETTTGPDGTFTLTTGKRVDTLSANTQDFKMSGELRGVTKSGNIVRISPK